MTVSQSGSSQEPQTSRHGPTRSTRTSAAQTNMKTETWHQENWISFDLQIWLALQCSICFGSWKPFHLIEFRSLIRLDFFHKNHQLTGAPWLCGTHWRRRINKWSRMLVETSSSHGCCCCSGAVWRGRRALKAQRAVDSHTQKGIPGQNTSPLCSSWPPSRLPRRSRATCPRRPNLQTNWVTRTPTPACDGWATAKCF